MEERGIIQKRPLHTAGISYFLHPPPVPSSGPTYCHKFGVFFPTFRGHQFFLWGHPYPCLRLLVMSSLEF